MTDKLTEGTQQVLPDDGVAGNLLRQRATEIRDEDLLVADLASLREQRVLLLDCITYLEAEIQKYHDQLLWLSTTKDEARELEYQNRGCESAATKLKEIAESGKHEGVFGGTEMEAAAQAIMKLHDRITRLEAVAEASKVVLEFDNDLPKDNLHAALQHAGYES